MNFRAKSILQILIPAVWFFLMAGLPAAAKEGDPMAEGKERHLNGHGFSPSVTQGFGGVTDPPVAHPCGDHWPR